jgi:hypothetical protein
VKSSQKRLYRRERNFAGVFFDDQRSIRDKPGFLEHSKLSRGYGRRLAQVFREQCAGFIAIRKPFASPIFVALGDETDMEDNRYKYHARPML